jgi:hypothetical protein
VIEEKYPLHKPAEAYLRNKNMRRGHRIMRLGFEVLHTESRALLMLLVIFSSCGGSGKTSEGLGVYPKAIGAADEAAAIQSSRAISSAQTQFQATNGAYGTFEALTQRGFLDQRFAGAAPNLKGYQFTMLVTDTGFSVNADPQTSETQPATGTRHFYLDSSDLAIHVNANQAASKSDPVL